MPLEIPMQSSGGDSGAADAFKPLVDSLDLVGKYLSDESPLFKRQNQLLQQLVQVNQRQLRTQAAAGRGVSGGAGGVGKQTEAISKNIATQDTASSALKSFESIVSLTTSPLSKFAKTTGFASVANIASIASTGKAALSTNSLNDAFNQTSSSTNSLNDAFTQTIKPIEDLRKAFASAGAGFTGKTTAAAAAPAAPAPAVADLDALQAEVNNLSADLYQAGMDLQSTEFYLQEFQNNLANANKPMNVLTEAFDNIGDTGGILSNDLNSLFGEVQRAFGLVDLREFQNKLFAAADAFAQQANRLNAAFDLDSMDKADLAFLDFTTRLTNATQPLSDAHNRMLDLAAVAGNAEENFDKADKAAKKLADQLKTAQAALAAAGGAPVPAAAAPAAAAAGGEDKIKQFADEISADFKMLFGGIKHLIKATYTKTKEVGKSAVNVVKDAGTAATSPVETMKTALGMGRNVAGAALKGGYGAAKGAVKGAGSALSTGVSAGFSTALKGATGALGSLTKIFGAAGGPIGMLATTIASSVIGNIVSFGMEMTYAADIMGNLGKITSGLGTYFGKMVNGALAPFAAAMQRSANAVERNSQAAEMSGLAMRRQAELAKTAGSIQKQTSDSVMNAVKNPLVGLPEIIKQMSSYVAIVDPAAAEQADLALKGFAGVIGQILRPALNILVGGLNLITGQLMSEKGFKGLSAAVATVATLIVERIKGIDFEKFVDELLKGAVSLIEALTTVGTVMTDLAWAFNGIVQVCSWLWDGLTALGQGVWYIVSTIFVAFIDGMKMITNIFIWVANSITSIITSIVNYVKSWVGGKKSEAPQMSYLTPSYEQDKMASKGPEKTQAPAFDTKTNVVGQAGFKGLGDVGKEMQQRSFKSGMTLEKAQLDMAVLVANLLKNPSSSALFEAFKNMGGGFVAPNANAQGA